MRPTLLLAAIGLVIAGYCRSGFAQDTPSPTDDPVLTSQVRAAFARWIGPDQRLDKVTAGDISYRSREVLRQLINQYDPKETVTASLQAELNDYTVLGIDKATVFQDIAFVEVRIKYDPAALPKIRQDEKEDAEETAEDKRHHIFAGEPNAGGWSSAGGTASEDRVERHGVGLATYALAKEHGSWKLHQTIFSFQPRAESDLASGAAFFQKELFKSPAQLAAENKLINVPAKTISSFSQLTNPSAWKTATDSKFASSIARNYGIQYNVCMAQVATKAELEAPWHFPSLQAFVASIQQPAVQVLAAGENANLYCALCRIKPGVCVYTERNKDTYAAHHRPEVTLQQGGNPAAFDVKEAGVVFLFDYTRVWQEKGSDTPRNNADTVYGTVYKLPAGYHGPVTMKVTFSKSPEGEPPPPVILAAAWN